MTDSHRIKIHLPLGDMFALERLVKELKTENRFVLSQSSEKFLRLLLSYATNHKVVTLKKGEFLFRARVNDRYEQDCVLSLDQMGAPPAHLTGNGRLNPRGISYLYLASSELTALSEVRPWVGCKATVAQFLLTENCELITISTTHFKKPLEAEEYKGQEFTWNYLADWLFRMPFDPRDDIAYIPSQYVAERIKSLGYKGIIYNSSVDPKGYNVTLFDPSIVTPTKRKSAKIKSIELSADITNLDEEEV